MITLNVYLTPREGRAEELKSAVRDKWLAAMAQQPGFLRAAVLKPFPDDELARALDRGRLDLAHFYQQIAKQFAGGQNVAGSDRRFGDSAFGFSGMVVGGVRPHRREPGIRPGSIFHLPHRETHGSS